MGNGNGVYVATESFSTEIDGEYYSVTAKETRVREGHILLTQNPEYFKPVDENVTYDLETATAAPGESRGGPGKDGASPEADQVEVPDGVTPGETPGWPVDSETGKPLALTDEQRAELAKVELDPTTSEVARPLADQTRKELDELAVSLGIENPDKLNNKSAVVEAIEAIQAAE